jgi:hypothetical protein
MGRLPQAPLEVRLAATLFLLLLGVADFFGAWQVKSFAGFTPRGVAATVQVDEARPMAMCEHCSSMATEHEVDLAALDRPRHTIGRELLVQDTHVHVPAYALTALALSLIVFGLALRSGARSAIVLLAFAAPFADFAGLWGAQLWPEHGLLFGGLAVAGGFSMGLAYLAVLVLALAQCWLSRYRNGSRNGSRKESPHA